jgi:hypothetical protein
MRFLKKRSVEHRAAVYDVRPIPGDKTQFEPDYLAMCDCEWFGDARASSEEAFRNAYAHTANVDDRLRHPVD